MGRYYSGDIEGKFWFAVQSSDDASFFGGSESEPNYILYYFDMENDFDSVMSGIFNCYGELGEYKEKLDKFWEKQSAYNDEMLVEHLGVSEKKVRELLSWYARLELGEKIWKCLEESDYCEFEAEL